MVNSRKTRAALFPLTSLFPPFLQGENSSQLLNNLILPLSACAVTNVKPICCREFCLISNHQFHPVRLRLCPFFPLQLYQKYHSFSNISVSIWKGQNAARPRYMEKVTISMYPLSTNSTKVHCGIRRFSEREMSYMLHFRQQLKSSSQYQSFEL